MTLTLPASYSTTPYPDILVSHHPPSSPTPTPIIIVTLNRPQAQNAFTDAMASSLSSLFPVLSLDPRVKCIVLTGSGTRAFCAGADLSSSPLDYSTDTPQTHRDGGGQVALAIHNCSKPVIAAITGSAVGVGITMTLPCSIRIVSENAKIGFVFARRGIVMEAASSFFLPRLVGWGKAVHLCTTGGVYRAGDKLFDGLFGEVLPQKRVLSRALEVAEEVVRNTSVVSTKLMRDLMWRGPKSAEATHLLDSKILLELFSGEDKKEGIDAFLEKRDANFEGTMERNAPSVWPWWELVDTKVPERVRDVKPKL
ncbi:enoyl-CoA hydratase/isomerase-like protein [Mollisia scopiformis]|uniref:Enoyl-CoA hydratase/isomeras-like protein n=1 Tax=Mollisia scopiformis TaxID=149040 RepID=A0A194XXM0_MOLSC|nr:enoyl-CoA hydratase/isomerase-like protein [Mollisia scopiformis]KUJ24577.1 enoyl-CoA hydratase/isomeras-like protein [Mollisia scopiformis]